MTPVEEAAESSEPSGPEVLLPQWSVGIEATGDQVMAMGRIVELADAVAPEGGIASGIGETRYGVKVVVHAESRERAIAKAKEIFREAARTADLPEWPISRVEAVGEDDEEED